MICNKCNREIPEGSTFCSYCGAKQESKLFCKMCGAELIPDSVFCNRCGAKVPTFTEATIESENNNHADTKAPINPDPAYNSVRENQQVNSTHIPEKQRGLSKQFQTRCYYCNTILTYGPTEIHHSPMANKRVQENGFSDHTGEICCPNCNSWLPHYDRNAVRNNVINLYTDAEVNVRLSDDIIRIEAEAFHDSSIETIVIPQTVEEVGMKAFMNCKSLRLVVFEGTPKLGIRLFVGCTRLEKIIIKNSLFPQEMLPFLDCTSLDEIECPESLDTFKARVLREVRGRKWANDNKCAYCGGEFTKGLNKKCSVCGKKKSY